MATKTVNYLAPNQDPWRVLRPDGLQEDLPEAFAEEGLTPEALTRLHGILEPQKRYWRIVRLLWGVQPAVMDPDADPQELRLLRLRELADELGVTPRQLKQEIDAMRGFVAASLRDGLPETDTSPEVSLRPQRDPDEDLFAAAESRGDLTDEQLLRRHRLWFDLMEPTDRAHLATRARQWSRALSHHMAGDLARQALLTEHEINRMQSAMVAMHPAGDDEQRYRLMADRLDATQKTYRDQMKQLDAVFPYMGMAGRGMSFSGALATITEAIREAEAAGDFRLVDGVHTAAEVEILLRRSAQKPDCAYRLGWVAHVNAARHGLFDPHWKNPIPSPVLRRLDTAFRRAYAEACESDGVPVPDLLEPGLEGEFPDRHSPRGEPEAEPQSGVETVSSTP